MSELKARHIVDVYDSYYAENPFGELSQVYLKSEADKVIAELENRIDEGDKEFDFANEQNERLLKIVRHHKYKRCLAMAEWCNSGMVVETFACFRPRSTKEVWREEHQYWAKWRKIWLELAEKFKEAKLCASIAKNSKITNSKP